MSEEKSNVAVNDVIDLFLAESRKVASARVSWSRVDSLGSKLDRSCDAIMPSGQFVNCEIVKSL